MKKPKVARIWQGRTKASRAGAYLRYMEGRRFPARAAARRAALRHPGERVAQAAPPHVKEYWFEEGCFITELFNTPEDPAVSIARARVPRDGTTRWHHVIDTVERYVIVDGRGRVEVGEEPPREVGPGDVVLIPPSCRQRIANIGDSELIFLAICTPRFVREAYRDA